MAKGGATKTEGGKTYIQSNSGMWVDKNTSMGQRVSNSVGSSGGSSGGSGRSSNTATLDPKIYPKGIARAGSDGVLRYSDGSTVKGSTQAYIDWNYGRDGGNRNYRDPHGSDEYNREYDRLLALQPGQNWVTGEWNYDTDGGGGGGGGGYTNYTDVRGAYIDRAAEEARAAQEAARRAAFGTSVNNLGNQKENSLREAYIRNQQMQQALPQQAQLMGGGGMSETTLAQMGAQYGNERTSLENAYLGAVSGLEADLNSGLAIDASQYYDRMAALAAQQRQEQLAREQMAMQVTEAQRDREFQMRLAAQKAAKTMSGTGTFTGNLDEESAANTGANLPVQNGGRTYIPSQGNTIATAPSLYGNDGKGGSWTTQGKMVYIDRMRELGKSDEEIAELIRQMGW